MSLIVMSITQLVYLSRATPLILESERPIADELRRINAVASAANSRVGITGILLYKAGNFLQVLEGNALVLNRLFNKISTDPRHSHVVRLATLQAKLRLFEKWNMGLLNLDEHTELDRAVFDDVIRRLRVAHPDNPNASHQAIVELMRLFQRYDAPLATAHAG